MDGFAKSAAVLDRLVASRGDITEFEVDVIVNAASHSLLGTSGVSGAIFDAAGPGLHSECAPLEWCCEGDAVITDGYELPARRVIHTVAPIWRGGGAFEDNTLAQCYRKCFELIEEHQLQTAAFPALGTGAHGFPRDRASRIAVREILAGLARSKNIKKVIVVCFDDENLAAYDTAINIARTSSRDGQR